MINILKISLSVIPKTVDTAQELGIEADSLARVPECRSRALVLSPACTNQVEYVEGLL